MHVEIPWSVILWGFSLLGGVGLLIFRSGAIYRNFMSHKKMYEEDAARNCAHHGILFKKLDIPYDEVLKAEKEVGVGPKR